MTFDESVDHSPSAVLTLAARRPGHAVMSQLLLELARGDHGTTVPRELQSWHTGAEGEVLVGQELARLPAEWRVLHAVPVGQVADIDHLVIGPPGAFVLNTKRHPGKKVSVGTHVVWVNGVQTNGYQKHVRERAIKVAAVLSSELTPELVVEPLLVFVDAREVDHHDEQTVMSVRMAGLVDLLLEHPHRLDAAQIEAAFATASHPVTWGRSASVLQELDPTARFLELQAAVPIAPTAIPRAPRSQRTIVQRRKPSSLSGGKVALGCFGAVLVAVLAPIGALLGVGVLSYAVQMLLR